MAGVLLVAGLTTSATASVDPPVQEQASLANLGETPGNLTIVTALSQDARYVLFSGPDFCCGDTNRVNDGYVRDRLTGTTKLVTGPTAGGNGNSAAQPTDITPDGHWVVFDSAATNLGPIDGAFAVYDTFVKDTTTGQVEVIDITDAGQINTNNSFPANASSISDDGRFVLFHSGAVVDPTRHPGKSGVYLRDRQLHTTTWVADGNVQRGDQALSADGRFVAYTNLGQDYVYDATTGTSELVSRADDGTPGNGGSLAPSISPDGRWVVYATNSTNIVDGAGGSFNDVLRYDRATHTTERVSVPGTFNCPAGTRGNNGSPRVADGGNLVSWTGTGSDLVPGDTNGIGDVFVRDMSAHRTSRVNTTLAGLQGDATAATYVNGGAFSADDNWVGYTSSSGNLVDGTTTTGYQVFVRNPPSAPDAPVPGPPTVTVDSPAMDEGNTGTTDQVFTVSLSHAACGDGASVHVTTQDGTATTADNDYQAVDQTVTFAPGETTAQVHVPVVGDLKVEDDETYTLTLSGASGASIGDGGAAGTGTIVNDDVLPASPTAHTDPVTGVGTTTATFNGTINPNGHSTSYHFEYVTDAQYAASGFDGATVTPGGGVGDDQADHTVAEGVTGLTPDTGYHVRVVADYVAADGSTQHLVANEVTFRTDKPAATAVFSCSATALRLSLLSLDIAHANPADSPCHTDYKDLARLATTTFGPPLGLLGLVTNTSVATGLMVSTTTASDTGGAATSTVNGLAVSIAGINISSRAISSGATVSCQNHVPVLSSFSRGTLVINGVTYADLAKATIPLPLGLGTIYVNRDIRTATDVIHRALEIEVPLLGIDLVVAEARADVHGDRCA